MFASFRSRLVISNLAITLIGLVVVVVVFTQVLANRSQDLKASSLETDSRAVASGLDFLFQQHVGSGKALQDFANSESRALQVRVIVVGPTGKLIVDSLHHTPFYSGSWYPLDRRALQQQRTASKQLQSSDIRSFQTPLQGTRGHRIGAVILVASVSAVQPGFGELADVFLVVFGAALLVWLAIGLYFTFSISRPLLAITAATARMAQGRYDTRVPSKGDSEISRLARSFNIMAEQVQATNRVLRDFVANVSHDLRTPLTMITGFSQAMLDGTARQEDTPESAQVIHEEAIRMERMVDDLLQLTQLESGLLTFKRELVEVAPFVQSVVNRTVRAHADKEVAPIQIQVPADLPLIEIDREQIERALRNLVNNALQYTPADGAVRVSGRAIGKGWVELEVSDSGIGIPQKDLERVFERFYRTSKSRERAAGHTGLGLAIVREIVEGHGGHVELESVPGKGTSFRFTVPQARDATAHREIAAPRETIQQQPASQ